MISGATRSEVEVDFIFLVRVREWVETSVAYSPASVLGACRKPGCSPRSHSEGHTRLQKKAGPGGPAVGLMSASIEKAAGPSLGLCGSIPPRMAARVRRRIALPSGCPATRVGRRKGPPSLGTASSQHPPARPNWQRCPKTAVKQLLRAS